MKMKLKPVMEQHTIRTVNPLPLPDFVANLGPAATQGVGGLARLLQPPALSYQEVIDLDSDSGEDDINFVYLTPPVKPSILFQQAVPVKQEHHNLLEGLTAEELFD